MINTCEELGFSVQPNKTVLPTTTMEYLGIEIDTVQMQLRISDERLNDIMNELYAWKHRKVCTKRDLLSIIGKLTFVSRVVRAGRTFVRRMIDESKKFKHLHYKITLNSCIQNDIAWWIMYLPTWNGVSFMYDSTWLSNTELSLWTDASDIALGGYLDGHWFIEYVNPYIRSYPISWRELYALVIALSTWGHRLQGKRILFYIDNSTVVDVNKGSSRSPELMTLVRALFYIAAGHNFEFRAEHLPSADNAVADALSRADIPRFRRLAPNADILPSKTGFVPIIK